MLKAGVSRRKNINILYGGEVTDGIGQYTIYTSSIEIQL